MKAILIFIAFLSGTNVFCQAPCNCIATTQQSHQQRTEAKHEENYDAFAEKQDTITVNYIYKWQKKYAAVTNTITIGAGSANSARQPDTPEDSMYTLKGYLWFVKTEDNDCDFHIEIGPKNVLGVRIVVEVPKENKELQKKIKAHLDSLHLKILNCGTSSTKTAHYDKPLKCVVTGLGFYDASHKPNTKHGDVHTKIYSWELHPVKDIEFL